MKMRTSGLFSGPATSAWTSSNPWSIATRSAIARTRSSIELDAISRTLRKSTRAKEKVGANPPDKTPRFEQAVNYTERAGEKQTGEVTGKRQFSCAKMRERVIGEWGSGKGNGTSGG